MISIFTAALSVLYLTTRVLGATYSQSDSHTGDGFFKAFSHQAMADPTHGRVNYVNEATAKRDNLTFSSGNHFILRADDKTVLTPSGPGRNSVRLQSHKQYTTSVMVFNILHMPQGCGTWPAVWTVGENWPKGGEIDVLEGVNDQGPNHSTLHTSPGCTMPSSRAQTGTALQSDCNTAVQSNTGCGVKLNDARSYGPTFNNNQGGWYAVERTKSFVKVWFWPRQGGNIPFDVRNGEKTVDTDKWGTPAAFFPNTECDIASKFGPHNIVINLTLCGDLAGSIYQASGCPSTCNEFVEKNPSAFKDAYFDFTWLKIYEEGHHKRSRPLRLLT